VMPSPPPPDTTVGLDVVSSTSSYCDINQTKPLDEGIHILFPNAPMLTSPPTVGHAILLFMPLIIVASVGVVHIVVSPGPIRWLRPNAPRTRRIGILVVSACILPLSATAYRTADALVRCEIVTDLRLQALSRYMTIALFGVSFGVYGIIVCRPMLWLNMIMTLVMLGVVATAGALDVVLRSTECVGCASTLPAAQYLAAALTMWSVATLPAGITATIGSAGGRLVGNLQPRNMVRRIPLPPYLVGEL
jgi:hypothetical protein